MDLVLTFLGFTGDNEIALECENVVWLITPFGVIVALRGLLPTSVGVLVVNWGRLGQPNRREGLPKSLP